VLLGIMILLLLVFLKMEIGHKPMMLETEILVCTMCNIHTPQDQLTDSQLIIKVVQQIRTKISHYHSIALKELGIIHTSAIPITPRQQLPMSDWKAVT